MKAIEPSLDPLMNPSLTVTLADYLAVGSLLDNLSLSESKGFEAQRKSRRDFIDGMKSAKYSEDEDEEREKP